MFARYLPVLFFPHVTLSWASSLPMASITLSVWTRSPCQSSLQGPDKEGSPLHFTAHQITQTSISDTVYLAPPWPSHGNSSKDHGPSPTPRPLALLLPDQHCVWVTSWQAGTFPLWDLWVPYTYYFKAPFPFPPMATSDFIIPNKHLCSYNTEQGKNMAWHVF